MCVCVCVTFHKNVSIRSTRLDNSANTAETQMRDIVPYGPLVLKFEANYFF